MTFEQVLKNLENAGTAQNRKIWARHGIRGEMFGVSFAHMGKLAKTIKTDHALAQKLWKTRNHDARILATMVADPELLDAKTIAAWLKDLDSSAIADAFSKLVAKSSGAVAYMRRWISSKAEFIGQAGWVLVALLAMEEKLADDECKRLLERIEGSIHGAKNRTKHAMNNALIAIGGSVPSMTAFAIASAKRIGVVDVDHGETSCVTPDAAGYILKMLAHGHKRKRC